MKIIHFSDIHTGGRFDRFNALFDKRIIGTLNYKLRRRRHVIWENLQKAIDIIEREKPDIVINTGDITSVSEPGEFAEALRRLQPIVDNNNHTFINVPGNHDHYVDNNECIKSKEATYNALNRDLLPIENFPHRLEKGGVTFIMVDESRPNSGTQSSGYLKPEDLKKIQLWASEAKEKPVVLVGHYPLKNKLGEPLATRRALENGNELVSMLEKGEITVNLCGHIHAPFIREEKSGSLEICAGSLTIGGHLNKLEFDSDSKSFSHSWIKVN